MKTVLNEEPEFGRVTDGSPEGGWESGVNNKEALYVPEK